MTLYTREIPKGDIQGMVQAIDEVNEYSKGEDLYIVSALENQDYLLNKLSVSGKVRKQMDRLYKLDSFSIFFFVDISNNSAFV